MSGMTNDKNDIRRAVRERRAATDPDHLASDGRAAQALMMAMPEFKEADVICCYLSMQGETGTEEIISSCFDSRRTLCVPVFRPELGIYEPAVMHKDSGITAGPVDVPEPRSSEWVSPETIDFMVVPALAFDPAGRRVGHGGGYYDRMMSAGGLTESGRPGFFAAGLAYEFQVFEEVPVTSHDVPVHAVVTEQRVIRC